MVTMKKLLMLLVAVLMVGIAMPRHAAAQDAAAPTDDPKATEAWKAWSTETDAAKKFQMGTELIKQFPGSKVAENVAGTDFQDPVLSTDQKSQIAKAYYDAFSTAG